MQLRISQLTDALFDELVYSKAVESAKERVTAALEEEYQARISGGKSQIQAFGEILADYGSLEAATAFAGVDASALLQPPNLDEKSYRRMYRKVWWLSIFIGWYLDSALLGAFQGAILKAPLYLISITLYLMIGLLFFRSYRKRLRSFSYDYICLSPTIYTRFRNDSDRIRKRLINGILLLPAFTAWFLSTTLELAQHTNMNADERIVLLTNKFHLLTLGIWICATNTLLCTFLCSGDTPAQRKPLWRYVRNVTVMTVGFLAVALLFTAILGHFLTNPYPIFYVLTALFMLIAFPLNYYRRAAIVSRNLVLNKPRIALYTTAAVLVAGISTMRKDVYVLAPYITQTAPIAHTEHAISYEEETGIYTITAEHDDFRILHLTDIHLGGSVSSSYKDYQALEACRRLIEYTQPDFIIVTGDLVFPMGIMSFSLNNESPVMQFASFLRNIGIPWAFTYGNHDTEAMATGNRIAIDTLYQSLSYKSTGNLLYPYRQPDITGRNNQLIRIENPDGTLRQALVLLDSNDYTNERINQYDYIHDDQVEWYRAQIEALTAEAGEIVPSMLFFHIPLQEYRTAYELYEQGSDAVKYFFGCIGETMINPICCSDYPSKLFDTAVELGSTQAIFCGHDHYNNISMEYRGIRLTYGMSIDYLAMPGIAQDTAQRGGELITLHPDGTFDLTQIPLTRIP